MAQNTNYAPTQTTQLASDQVVFAGKGVYGEVNVVDIAIDNTTNIDLVLVDDMLLTGGVLMVKGGHFEDKVCMQVVHPVAGVVNEFVTDYRIAEDSIKQFELNSAYPAKIPAGLTLRVKYIPFAVAGLRDIAANYYLHKILS